ncbi:MAG TPA: PEP/pyruvate-binding domain-containing protein [Candidatus Sulfotelmatobacter sp.]|jgi:pyruvate,water dikinase|nr:PEP/pyruvate-binding domain-containing protein [Candidatus Sulfotelmatobacter sp.]
MGDISPIMWFANIDLESELIGKQTKHLARLAQAKLPILPGFVITSKTYTDFLQENKLDLKIKQLLTTIAIDRPDSLMQGEYHIKQLFKKNILNEQIKYKIVNFYQQLGGNEVSISLYETGIHERKHKMVQAKNVEELFEQIINLWAEMFSSNAIWHRHQHGHNHVHADAELIIQRKVNSDITGIVTTIDPSNHEKDKLVIMTHHTHKGDLYVLSKKTLTIIDRTLNHRTNHYRLTSDEILEIGKIAKKIEEKLYFPHEIMWVIDKNSIYITTVKPFTSLEQLQSEKKKRLPIVRGKGITARIGTGIVKIINSSKDLQNISAHDIFIVTNLETYQLPHMTKIQGIIVESNEPNSMLLQYPSIPAIVNVKHAKNIFKNGHIITIHGAKGEIYRGGFF